MADGLANGIYACYEYIQYSLPWIYYPKELPVSIAIVTYPLGTAVFADFLLFRHRGIITGYDSYGRPLVTSNSRRRGHVVQESIDEFRQGREVAAEVDQGRYLPIVAQRAASGIGRKYDFFSFNCDHFVEWAKGNEPVSDQIIFWGTAIGAAVLLTFALRSK
jgi:hypothetical protein